ncbi:geranylgeranyl diphosphate synthase, type I [Streptomyces sp. Ag82_O1-12]|uniref:polyprenyl synthetase family protein n=1 Tax=unclassified Streptomyces TaxID=2593676 RepID=UPI000BC90AA5|nr:MULTISPECIES: polyprenyl synthetase family protein [unclassified Streptomyces]SMQ18927.1 geranylgeranyl diphosphate synthase, type I [Streptomyces sp. Ag82_O1-12]SOD47967.1 geranylgeranyl diphosphate synthase, type I [Streptomyces sp. Ag82_G6-1]
MTTTPALTPVLDAGVTQARSLLPPLLREQIATLGDELSRICGYQLGLCDADGTPIRGNGGKLVRPAFSLLCTEAAGGSPEDVLSAASAIELLHNASLIHDDIMDGDHARRHRPTVWARFGVPLALLAGDALIALGFEVLGTSRHPATAPAVADLARTLRHLAIGQEQDLRFEREQGIGIEDSLAMLGGKTGALLACACRMGARYASAPPDWTDRFGRFGMQIGVAFQLVDDDLGIWGDPVLTGKPVGSDLRARKKSAPVVAALRAGTAESARLARLYAMPGDLTDTEVLLMAELIESAGGRQWARAEADRLIEAAWDLLDPLDLAPHARSGLSDLTTALTARRH